MEEADGTIPTLDIDSAETVVRAIHYRLDGKVPTSDEEKLAHMLGHETADSGAFRSKLADLRKYGFIDGYRDKELTELGKTLIQNKERAVRTILQEIELFKKANLRFGTSIPAESEWEEFLRAQGITHPDESDLKQARDTYNSLLRQLPAENDEPFSGDAFEKYYSDLDDEYKKSLCLKSLGRLVSRPIPSIEYYNKIFLKLNEVDDPEDEVRLLEILKKMCYTSTEKVRDERLDDTVNLAMGFLDPAYSPKIRMKAIRILEAMHPPKADECDVEDLWDITQEFARKGHKEDDDDLLKHARQLFDRLVDEWADDSLLETMWGDTYDEYDESTSYGKFVGYWHEECQEAIGMT